MIETGDITLGGLALNNSLQWTNRYQSQRVAQSAERTLGGGIVLFSRALQQGDSIMLEATAETGWLNRTMVDGLLLQAEADNQAYELVYHGETYTVRYAHHEPPALSFSPLQAKSPGSYDAPNDWFIGTIKLITV